ncbi:MAG: hypothetical protein L6413_06365, partial [Coriobacteriia bacterium]|nr:hypothetical protein [Coriobacteriia bacterium]
MAAKPESVKKTPVSPKAAKVEPKAAKAKKPAAATKSKDKSAELGLPEVTTLAKMGKKKGNLTDEEIQSAISDMDLSEDQVDVIYASFRDAGIEIVDEPVTPGTDNVATDDVADEDITENLAGSEKEHIAIPL